MWSFHCYNKYEDSGQVQVLFFPHESFIYHLLRTIKSYMFHGTEQLFIPLTCSSNSQSTCGANNSLLKPSYIIHFLDFNSFVLSHCAVLFVLPCWQHECTGRSCHGFAVCSYPVLPLLWVWGLLWEVLVGVGLKERFVCFAALWRSGWRPVLLMWFQSDLMTITMAHFGSATTLIPESCFQIPVLYRKCFPSCFYYHCHLHI